MTAARPMATTRIIRQGYFEHPSYVPLVRAAYPLWRELAAEAGEPLIDITGIVEIGAADSELVTGTLAAARQHGLAHEVLDAAALRRRFPLFQVPDDYVAVFQSDGGFLRAEPAIRALLARARADGAQVRTGEPVRAIEPRGDGVRVVTTRGTIDAGCAVVAAGPWVKTLLPSLPVPIRVTRQVLAWFAPRDPALFAKDRFPVFLLENPDGMFYGFPDDGTASVKVAKHHHADETVDPERCDRVVSAADEAMIRSCLAAHLPAGRRAARRRHHLPLHYDARRRFHSRPDARPRPDHRRLALFGPRLQVRPGDRRDHRRSRDARRDRPRYLAVCDRPVCEEWGG